ncbi:MAG TPA: hypothetical protein DCR93_23445 [Cytophagales bacterium]|nr:hypothetical protein [Cytophagales bacterium]
MQHAFPHKGFRFRVSFLFAGSVEIEGYFQSVNGLKGGYSPGSYQEGGVSAFTHQLTERSAYGPLTLKKGLTQDNFLYSWCQTTFQTMRTVPANVLISLLDEKREPVENWMLVHAIPTNWDATGMDSGQSQIMIESIQLSYQYFMKM